jgi:putative tricarboxylic transport membrane protein
LGFWPYLHFSATRQLALKFGYYEYFAVGIFSLTLIASLSSGSVFKGVASAAFGTGSFPGWRAPIGWLSPFSPLAFYQLNGGLNILPVLIGLFA